MIKHIRIIGLSSHVEKDKISSAITLLQDAGYRVSVSDQVYKKEKYSAGNVRDKLNALHEAFIDNDVDFILCSVGGNGAIHLLNQIDYKLIKNNPKPICGFSDVTSILNAIHQKTNIITYHGPTATQLHRGLPEDQITQFKELLNETMHAISFNKITVNNPQQVSGKLIGGNLSIFQTLLGTSNMPHMKDTILFLEDVGDEISRYDRMLTHLKNAGILNEVSAILFGDFHSNDTPRRVHFGKTIDEIIDEITKDINIPIVKNCPFGHRGNLWTLPIGQRCTLTFTGTNKITMHF